MTMSIQQLRIATDDEVKWFLNASDLNDENLDDYRWLPTYYDYGNQVYKLCKKHNLIVHKKVHLYACSHKDFWDLSKEPPMYEGILPYVKLIEIKEKYFQCGYYMRPCWFNKKHTVSMFDNLNSFNKYCLHYMDLKNPTAIKAIHHVNNTFEDGTFIEIGW